MFLESGCLKSIPTYSPLDGGIKSVEFSDQPEGKNSPFKLYTLAVDETDEVFIDVQHQSLQEKIVAGVLSLFLQMLPIQPIKSI
jgi:hypothetical protein